MRDFFIKAFEILVGVIVVLMAIGILLAAGAVAFGSPMGMNGMMGQTGILPGLVVLIAGTLYLTFVGGLLYLGLGIYHNTRRTAEATERLVDRR
jgi:uncharacterized membrane protein